MSGKGAADGGTETELDGLDKGGKKCSYQYESGVSTEWSGRVVDLCFLFGLA